MAFIKTILMATYQFVKIMHYNLHNNISTVGHLGCVCVCELLLSYGFLKKQCFESFPNDGFLEVEFPHQRALSCFMDLLD